MLFSTYIMMTEASVAQEFDFFKIVGDIGKGVGDVAKGAADMVMGALGQNQDAEPRQQSLPDPQYREGDPSDRDHCGTRTINVEQIGGVDHGGRELSDRSLALKISKNGVELMTGNWPFLKRIRQLSVRNCTVYKSGDVTRGNPLGGVIGGGYSGSIISSTLASPAAAPVGAVIGAVVGAVSSSSARDIWFMELIEHDGTVWTFRLGSQSDGNAIQDFLDAHYSL